MRKSKIVFTVSVGLALAVLPARVSLAQTAQEVIVPNGANGVDPVAVSGTSALVGSPDASVGVVPLPVRRDVVGRPDD